VRLWDCGTRSRSGSVRRVVVGIGVDRIDAIDIDIDIDVIQYYIQYLYGISNLC